MANKGDILGWYGMMQGATRAMSEQERAALLEWERRNLDGGTVGTSDWPGWEKYIGKIPAPLERPTPNKVTVTDDLRWFIWERDNFTCQHCGTRRNLAVDHIFPESLGGSIDPSNLQTLCKRCNSIKGARI